MSINTKLFYVCFASAFFLSLMSCSKESTPEEIISSFIDKAEVFIEERNSRKVRNLISEQYHDNNNRTKPDIASVASGYILRNQNLHVISRITSVQQNDTDTISSTSIIAFSAKPIADVSILPTLNADIYWFDFTIVREKNEWKLINADWRQAMVDDFFD